tara:strand:+ start:1569 stop:3596 length:2028 start_codon:yes stop_codon:yes gene_type:complete
MANPFRSRDIPSSVKSEFSARSNDTKLMKWTAQRFPWIYVLSCAGGSCSSKYNKLGQTPQFLSSLIGGKAVNMLGGRPSSGAYNPSTQLPYPTITGLSVKAMGSLGTTRKATLKLNCYTDEELLDLQKCYFIPGLNVRVQWGWNIDCNGNPAPPVLSDPSLEPTKVVCQINTKRKSSANYDGFQGIVGNFGYNLNADNIWECSIEIISAADPFTDSKVSNSNCGCPREVETDGGEKVKAFGPIYAALADMYENGESNCNRVLRKCRNPITGARYHHWSVNEFEGIERTETGGEKDGSWYDGLLWGGEDTTETWISFGAFIDMLNHMSIPNDSGIKFPLGSIDTSDILLPKPYYCMSADPRVCIIGGGDCDVYDDLDFDHEGGRRIPDCIEGDKVRLNNIMCNVIMLLKNYKQVYDGDGKLKTLLDNVMNEINRVCGTPWQFVTIASQESCDSATGPILQILDERQKMEALAPFDLPSQVGDSTLRSFGLKLKMTGAMKTNALYSGNNQNARGGKDDSGCSALAGGAFFVANDIEDKAKPKPKTLTTECGDCDSSSNAASPPGLEDIFDEMSDEVNDQSVGALQTYIDKKVNKEDKKKCAGTPLPFDFNFEVDGIGGFEFGQMVSSTRIPEGVRKEFRWQVTKVEHEISVNDWTTSVSTVCRSNPFGNKASQGFAR